MALGMTVTAGTYATGDANLTVTGATSIAGTLDASGQSTSSSDFNGAVSGAGSLSSAPNGTTVAGGITVATLTANGLVTIDGPGNLGVPAGYTLGSLTFAAGVGNTIASQGPLTITTGLTLTSGDWDAGSDTHNIGGNWDSSAANFAFTENSSSINLTASPPTVTTAGAADSFYNLSLPNGASVTTDLTVSNQTTAQGSVSSTATVALDLGALLLSGGLSLDSTGGTIAATTIDGAFDLTLAPGAGTTTVSGAVGGGTPIGDGTGAALTINSTGTTEFQSTVATDSGILQADTAGGVTFRQDVSLAAGDTATAFNADVLLDGLTFASDGAVTFGNGAADALTLQTAPVTLRTTGAGDTLTVNAATDGDVDLLLDTADAASFTAAVGSVTPIGDGIGAAVTIDSPGTTEFGNFLVTASGITQSDAAGEVTFRDDVTIGAGDTPTTFDADVVLDGLVINADAPVTFGNATTDSLSTTLVGVTVNTTNDTVTLNSSVTLSSADLTINTDTGLGDILFNAPVTGGNDLSLAAGTGGVTFNDVVSGPFGSGTGAAITVSSGDLGVEFVNAVTTAGALSITPDVTFRQDVTIGAGTSGSNFDGNVSLDGLTMNAGRTVTFGDALADTITLSTAAVSISTTANDGDLDFNGPITGAQDLTLTTNGTGRVIFAGDVTVGATALNALTIDAAGVDLEANVDLNTATPPVDGDISLTVDDFTLAGTNTVNAGTATVQLTPQTTSYTIEFGDTDTPVVTDVYYDSGWTGFTAGSFTIGAGTHTGNITMSGTASAPYTLQVLNGVGGGISVTGGYSSTGSLTLDSGSGGVSFDSVTVDLGAGALTVPDPVTLTGAGVTTIQADGGIQLQSTVTGTSAGAEGLILEAVGSDITVTGGVGATRLGALSVSNVANLQFGAGVTAASFTQSAGSGTTTFSGAQDYTGNFDFNGQALSVSDAMSVGGATFITNAGAFTKAVTGTITSAGGFTQDGAGGNTIGSNVTTSGSNLSFDSAVTLSGSVQFSSGSGAGNIGFTSTVDGTSSGTEALAVDAGTGTIVFQGAVGQFVELGGFTIQSGAADLRGNSLTVLGPVLIESSLDSDTLNGGATNVINVTGNWTNNGTFAARTSEVLFNGGATSSVDANGASGTFNDITVAGATTVQAINTALFASGTVTISAASDTIDTANQDFDFAILANSGDLRLDGTQATQNIGATTPAPPTAGRVVYYDGAANGYVRIPTATPVYDLVINAPGRTILMANELRLYGSVTLAGGTFDGNGQILTLAGDFDGGAGGSFAHGNGTVSFFGQDVQPISFVYGSNTFYNFLADVSVETDLVVGNVGKVIRFESGTTTTIASEPGRSSSTKSAPTPACR